MNTPRREPRLRCYVCKSLPEPELLEFNALLGNPDEWPSNLLAEWDVPKKLVPGRMRRWGGLALGVDYFKRKGIPITRDKMLYHFTNHVVHIATTPKQVIEVGKMAMSDRVDPNSQTSLMPAIRPRLYIDYYSKGIQLGVYALDELKARIHRMEEKGEAVPDKVLWQLADLGAKLSQSLAGMAARGSRQEQDDDEVGGFREGSAPLPSQRFGGSRIRTIEGEARPVVDEGRADRMAYNERARQEGSPTLPV